MTWLAIAKKDFRDAVQSRALWALVAGFVLLSLVSTYAYVQVPELFGEPTGATFAGLVFFTVGLTGLFVPLAAIVVCYKSLAGERELGSIKLLLSLPTNRLNVFTGKVVGRAAVLVFGLGIGLLVGLGFGSVLLGTVALGAMLVFVLVTLGFAAIYAEVMVGLSATTGSTSRATTFALGSLSSLSCSGMSSRWRLSTSLPGSASRRRCPSGCSLSVKCRRLRPISRQSSLSSPGSQRPPVQRPPRRASESTWLQLSRPRST